MTPKNIPEFIALIKRYESITLEEIESLGEFTIGNNSIHQLTGFGGDDCTLCKAVKRECNECVYDGRLNCLHGALRGSFMNIQFASSPDTTIKAIRDRAKIMRQYAVNIGINIE